MSSILSKEKMGKYLAIFMDCKSHGEQIYNAASSMRQKHDDIGSIEKNSFLDTQWVCKLSSVRCFNSFGASPKGIGV
jgi:hypothetical protein